VRLFGESMLSESEGDVEPATVVAHGGVVVMCLPESFLKTIKKWRQEGNTSTLYDLELSDLSEVGVLGKGAFGTVLMVRVDGDKNNRNNGKILALKKFSKMTVFEDRSFDSLLLEKEIMLAIKPHPFVLKLRGTFQDDDNLYMLTELCQGGELMSLIHNNAHGALSEDWARFYAGNVFLALEHLHEQDWIYRDLKPENVMLDSDGYIKLIDMGFAKKLPFIEVNDDGSSTTHTRAYTVCGTPAYLAPEFIMQTGYNAAVDYWALGVLVFEMMVGCTPFETEDGDLVNLFKNIVLLRSEDKAVELPQEFVDVFPDVADLICRLLTGNPVKRLGMLVNGTLDIRTHSWFKTYNFDDIVSKSVKPPYSPNLKSDTDLTLFKKTEAPQFDKFTLPPGTKDPFIEF